MNLEWIPQTKETRRVYSNATWIPLRASIDTSEGNIKDVGDVAEYFGCGSVAFAPEYRALVEESLSWHEIGIGNNAVPYAYEDGYYASIEQYQYKDKQPIGINLVFEHPQPFVGGRRWILNPDIVVALGLIKEGTNWVRPEENFVVVARERCDEKGNHCSIEIKREFLIDYLAARNLLLRLSYYRQRVVNVSSLQGSSYEHLLEQDEQRDGGRFKLQIRELNDVYGGGWSVVRAWRTDIDEDEDAPIMGPEGDDNTAFESAHGQHGGYIGVRVESAFWRDEWVEHKSQSVRVRGDVDPHLPQFIVSTDGERMASSVLNTEDVGRWLWFRSDVISALLANRGFKLSWHTRDTGCIHSTSGYYTEFGLNSSDFVTAYAYDIARLASWEQQLWAAYNVSPEGKVSSELLAAQVSCQPASTVAAEVTLFCVMRKLEDAFHSRYQKSLFSHDIVDDKAMQFVCRFHCNDQASLLRLAKEIIRVFSDRLNVHALRELSTHTDKEKHKSNKLLQDILSQHIGADEARRLFSVIVGTYDMRTGDSHPTGSKIAVAINLAGVDQGRSFLRQGEQLLYNFGQSLRQVGSHLFGDRWGKDC
jgi:hypothetical protein